jgi:hypothetical protein
VLLEVLVKEPLLPVRRSTADVVSVVAKHTVPQVLLTLLPSFPSFFSLIAVVAASVFPSNAFLP